MDRETKVTATDAVVVGGGLGGLAAALGLARSGVRVTLLERASRPGGRAISQRLGGGVFNLGPHALYLGGPAVALLRAWGIPFTGGEVKGEGAFGWRAGRLHTLPSGPVSLLTTGLVGLRGRVELARLLGGLRRVDTAGLEAVPLGAWLAENVRDPAARAVARTVFRVSTYCGDVDALSAAVAIRQLALALANVLYVDGGWQTLVDAFVDRCRHAGVAIHLRSRVESISRSEEGGWRVRTAGGGVLAAGAVVIAGGTEAAVKLLPDEAAEVKRRISQLRPSKVACLDVSLTKLPRPRHLLALGIDRPTYASVHSHWARLGDDGSVVVHALRYLAHGEDALEVGAEALLEEVLDALQPGWRDHVRERRFMPNLTVMGAVPLASQGGFAGRPEVTVPGAEGLFLVGDSVGHGGILLDAVLTSAEAAVRGAVALRMRVRAPVALPVRREPEPPTVHA